MRCLYCGKGLALFRRLAGAEFCSDEHRQRYRLEFNELALNRLIAASEDAAARPKTPEPLRRVENTPQETARGQKSTAVTSLRGRLARPGVKAGATPGESNGTPRRPLTTRTIPPRPAGAVNASSSNNISGTIPKTAAPAVRPSSASIPMPPVSEPLEPLSPPEPLGAATPAASPASPPASSPLASPPVSTPEPPPEPDAPAGMAEQIPFKTEATRGHLAALIKPEMELVHAGTAARPRYEGDAALPALSSADRVVLAMRPELRNSPHHAAGPHAEPREFTGAGIRVQIEIGRSSDAANPVEPRREPFEISEIAFRAPAPAQLWIADHAEFRAMPPEVSSLQALDLRTTGFAESAEAEVAEPERPAGVASVEEASLEQHSPAREETPKQLLVEDSPAVALEAAPPEITQSEIAKLEIAQSDVAEPEIAEPELTQRETGQPAIDQLPVAPQEISSEPAPAAWPMPIENAEETGAHVVSQPPPLPLEALAPAAVMESPGTSTPIETVAEIGIAAQVISQPPPLPPEMVTPANGVKSTVSNAPPAKTDEIPQHIPQMTPLPPPLPAPVWTGQVPAVTREMPGPSIRELKSRVDELNVRVDELQSRVEEIPAHPEPIQPIDYAGPAPFEQIRSENRPVAEQPKPIPAQTKAAALPPVRVAGGRREPRSEGRQPQQALRSVYPVSFESVEQIRKQNGAVALPAEPPQTPAPPSTSVAPEASVAREASVAIEASEPQGGARQPGEVQSAEVLVNAIRLADLQPNGVHSEEVQPANAQPANAQPANAQPADVQANEVRPSEAQPSEAPLSEAQSAAIPSRAGAPAPKPYPLAVAPVAPQKGKPIQIFPQALAAAADLQSARMEALPIRPMIVISQAATPGAAGQPLSAAGGRTALSLPGAAKGGAQKPSLSLLTPAPKDDDFQLPELKQSPGLSRSMLIKLGAAASLVLMIAFVFLMLRRSPAAPPTAPLEPPTAATVGQPNAWIDDFSPDPKHARTVTLLRSSADQRDYRIEFESSLEVGAAGWVFRARDAKNFYVARIEERTTASGPVATLARYPVIDGVALPAVRKPLPVKLALGEAYKIRFEASGNHFTTWVQEQKSDEWTDDRLLSGGAGLYAESGERATLRGSFSVVPLLAKQ